MLVDLLESSTRKNLAKHKSEIQKTNMCVREPQQKVWRSYGVEGLKSL